MRMGDNWIMNSERNPGRLRAAIVVRAGTGSAQRVAECGAYCARYGYEVRSVTLGDPEGRKWARVQQQAMAGEYDVIVVRDRGDVPPDRVPRLEVVAEEPLTPPRQRDRPRRVRRLRLEDDGA